MKTISEFKKNLAVGKKLHAINHLTFAGRDEKGNVLYKDADFGIREVSKVQSNSFALKTTRKDTGEVVDSWCSYPRATDCIFNSNGSLTILESHDGIKVPVLTYKFIE